jgi:small subunit ribosomal protein S1
MHAASGAVREFGLHLQVFNEGDRVRAVVIGMDEGFSRISVSTRDLELSEGDMLTDPQKVYDNAEQGVTRFLEHVKKWEAEQAGDGGEAAA